MPFIKKFSKCVVPIAVAMANEVPASTKLVTGIQPVRAVPVSTKPAIVTSTGHKALDPNTLSHLLSGRLSSQMHQPADLVGAAAVFVLLVLAGAAAAGVVASGATAAGGAAAAAAGGHPRTFPGPQGVISNNQDLHQHLEVIFGLVFAHGAHLETSTCSKRGIAAWRGVYDA